MMRLVGHDGLPLQGGLPPTDGTGGASVEIACDESGFSGTNLLDVATPVFTHASVDLRVDEAVELVRGLRSGPSRSLGELKSAQFLRGPRGRDALRSFLAELSGRAHVHVTDKEYFLTNRVVDLFLLEPSYTAGTRLSPGHPTALSLYRAGRTAGPLWTAFLASFVALVRTKGRHQPDHGAVGRFLQARDALQAVAAGDTALRNLDRARVLEVVTRLVHDDRTIPPPLEPLLPALAETVLHWSNGQRQVLVIHDEQSALTAGRLRRLQEALTPGGSGTAAAGPVTLRPGASPLAGLVTVDSRSDARIQVADLLAGITRRSPGLGVDDLLHAFVSSTSLRDPAAP